MKTTASVDEVYKVIFNDHRDPFTVLGCHPINLDGKSHIVVRSYLPEARTVSVCPTDESPSLEYPMERIHSEGFFEVLITERSEVFPYRLKVVTGNNETRLIHDSYSFLPTLDENDLYLFNKGDHHRIYEKLGAHLTEVRGVRGVQFAVWAPTAKSVSVIGTFNNWDRRSHAMRILGASGIWEIFIPGLQEGELYKYHIRTNQGIELDKADPYGFEMELRPQTASRVNFLSSFQWHDTAWVKHRDRKAEYGKPVAIYEVHLGSWQRGEQHEWLSYRESAERLVDYISKMGYTHLELMPVMEHPFDGSWGYQVTGYFAPTSRFGRPEELMYLIDLCHRNNIGVIIDWVPAHFPKDMFALANFDGTHLYEHDDPRKGEHQDWGTFIFNYGRHEVQNFLISNALFWIDKYHVDGIRIDAVASMLYLDYSRKEGEWVPNRYGGRENLEAIDFLRHLNSVVHKYHPGVLMIAEESTSWPGVTHSVEHQGLGFDLKWNMGWMHDMLEYFSKDPIYRPSHHKNLTFALFYAFSERFLLPLSHDEVVHGKRSLLDKMPGDVWKKFANLRSLFGLMYGFPGKKLLFMGGEIGQWREWSHERGLDWHLLSGELHAGLSRWIADLNKLYRSERSMYEIDFDSAGFEWIDFQDVSQSVISFERKPKRGKQNLIIVCNFTPVPRSDYRIGVAEEGVYRELLNSDATVYGGSNMGNLGEISSDPVPKHGRPNSLNLTLPPLSIMFFKRKIKGRQ
jgi:1,4-alpha-glucan branching enzyme